MLPNQHHLRTEIEALGANLGLHPAAGQDKRVLAPVEPTLDTIFDLEPYEGLSSSAMEGLELRCDHMTWKISMDVMYA